MNNKELTFKLIRVSQLRRWHLGIFLKGVNDVYSTQTPFLKYINDHPNCQQQDLVKSFSVSRAAVSKSIKRMLASKLIVRNNNFQLDISNKGKSLINAVENSFDDLNNLSFQNFNDKELQEFDNYLNRIINNLDDKYTRDNKNNEKEVI